MNWKFTADTFFTSLVFLIYKKTFSKTIPQILFWFFFFYLFYLPQILFWFIHEKMAYSDLTRINLVATCSNIATINTNLAVTYCGHVFKPCGHKLEHCGYVLQP